MKTELMTQVTSSIFEVMETMFFLTLEESGDHDDKALHQEIGKLRTSAITFSGEFSGKIFLSIPEPLLKSMTENFLGQDIATLTTEHVDGTLKEALNMIAGSALTRVDDTTYMGLGIPEIVPSPDPEAVDETAVLNTAEASLIAQVKIN